MTAPISTADSDTTRIDVLSDILGAFRLHGTLYFRTDFTAPWAVAVPPQSSVSRFHVALRGGCWVGVPGLERPVRLEAGDLLVIPHGSEHTLSSSASPPDPTPLDRALESSGYRPGPKPFRFGDGGEPCNLVCGYFDFDKDVLHPLMDALPPAIHIEGTRSRNFGWLDDAMTFMGEETRLDHPGWEAITRRLSEIIFIQTVRAYMQTATEIPPYAGITDPHVGRSLEAIHGDLQTPWTVENLARRAGLSRSVFAERFHRLVGQSPLHYVTSWRIQQAKMQLVQSEATVSEVALEVGYRSEAAFSRAFKRLVGIGPARFRATAPSA